MEIISYAAYLALLPHFRASVLALYQADWRVVVSVSLAGYAAWKLMTWALFLAWVGCLVWLRDLRRGLACEG